MTKAELQTAIDTVNTAIAQLLSGKRVLELQVGTGDFMRRFRYGEVSLDSLKDYRAELVQMMQSLASDTPSFRKNASIPLHVRKAHYG